MAEQVAGALPRGRTEPLEATQVDRLFREGVAIFNAARYWHAHEVWETLWRAATEEERDFFQGLILVAAGLLHIQRRNARGARNKLAEGIAKLAAYHPVHRAMYVTELVRGVKPILEEVESGHLPHLIPPVIRVVDRDGSA